MVLFLYSDVFIIIILFLIFRSYSGFNLFHQADKQLAQLKQQLGSLNKYDTTVYYTAGYDSPFSFTNRHNEVWLMASDNGSPEVSVVGRR